MKKPYFIGVLISFFVSGGLFIQCTNSTLHPEEYVQWVEDYQNGLHVNRKVDNFIFDLQYTPGKYLTIKENVKQIGKDSNAQEDFDYFLLKLSTTTGDFLSKKSLTSEELNKKLYYFSFRFENDIKLITDTDTIPCSIYHFERAYDLKNSRSFLLGFKKVNKGVSINKVISIDSDEIGLGTINIKINKEAFEDIPKIKI